MAIFKCKMCGGTIEFQEGETVGVCDSCGSKQTLPTFNDEVIGTLHSRANNLRLKCEFDKAEEIYNRILEKTSDDAEAHWGVILCKYGIEYVEDPATLKRIPTCHRTLYEAILADEDYKQALSNGTPEQRELYESEAKEIDRIQRDILAIVKNEKPFDVFICYKETDFDGKRTQDSVIANDIYYELTQAGFKVFYSAITLEDKLGQEFEPYIFSALSTAKVMLVIATDPAYYTSVWVKNEWSRFLKRMKTNRDKLLIPCYRDMSAYELPEEFAHLQAQDMSKIGFINDVVRGIKKVINSEKTEVRPRETAVVNNAGNANTTQLLKRMFMFLEDGEWDEASSFSEQILNLDAECAEAYLGKLMVDLQVRKVSALQDLDATFEDNSNFKKAIRFGNAELTAQLKEANASIAKRKEEEKKENIYRRALQLLEAGETENACMESVEMLKSLSGYKDADELANKASEKAEAIRIKAKEDQKKAIYANALERVGKKFTSHSKELNAIEESIKDLTKLSGYKDADEKIESLNDRKEKITVLLAEEKKKNKQKRQIFLISAGAGLALAILFFTLILPAIKKGNYIKTYSEKAYALFGILEKDQVISFGSYLEDSNFCNSDGKIEWTVLEFNEKGKRVLLKANKPLTKADSLADEEPEEWLNNEFKGLAFSKDESERVIEIKSAGSGNKLNLQVWLSLCEHKCGTKFDNTSHWKECEECGLAIEKEVHSYQNADATTCDNCAFSRGELTGLSIKSPATVTQYFTGDGLDTTGLTLTAKYGNGIEEDIEEGFTCSPSTLTTAGTQKITVSYGGKNTTFNVNVTAVNLLSISVKTNPAKTQYYQGDTLDTAGLVLSAKYDNNTTKDITSGFTCTPTKLSTLGNQTITVSYGGKNTSFVVVVVTTTTAVGSIYTFGTYPQTASGTDNTPIEWIVLDVDKANNKMLLLSKYALDCKRYDDNSANWANSEIRSWLDNTFISKAFNSAEQTRIKTTTLANPDGPYTHSGDVNTTDKVFLLSHNEVKTKYASILNGEKGRMCSATAYAIAQGAEGLDFYSGTYTDTSLGTCWGWLRSPFFDGKYACAVYLSGDIYGSSVYNTHGAVRPALWISLP